MSNCQQISLPPFSLVLGGARSGKSGFAERLASGVSGRRIYVATAEPFDNEMQERIARHRADRAESGWETVEAPRDVVAALKTAEAGVFLVDCLTLWLSNHLLAGNDPAEETALLSHAIIACPAPVIAVSNEVGWSIVPDNALARRFRDEQGRLNQALAARADLVIGVMAGLPMVLKGTLPEFFDHER